MKFKSILLLMLALCLTVCLCACGDDTATDKKDGTTTAGSTAATSTTSTTDDSNITTTTEAAQSTTDTNNGTTVAPTDPVPTQPVDGKANYTVTVVDQDGNPVPGAFVQLCLEACIPCVTNAQGVATWESKDVADYKVSFINVPEGYILPTGTDGKPTNYYFEENTYAMTLVLETN